MKKKIAIVFLLMLTLCGCTKRFNTEVDVDTKILSWDDLYNGILDIDENVSLPVEVKSRLTMYLCTEEL